MKYEHSQMCWLAVTSLLIVSLVADPAESARKCRGRWAIHACFGGNGKRSDPTLERVAEPSLLRQYLLRESPPYPVKPLADVADENPSEDTLDDFGTLNSGDYPQYVVSPSVDRLTALLRTLRTLQKENEALP